MSHQLEGWHIGSQAEEINLPLLDGIDEKDLQQRQVQVKQHGQFIRSCYLVPSTKHS